MATYICEYCHEQFEAPRKGCQTKRFCSMSCRRWLAGSHKGRPWTVNHTALLLAAAESVSDDEAGSWFDLNGGGVRTLRRGLGLLKRSYYSEVEDAILREFFPHASTLDLAELLGRPEGSIDSRARKLGLAKSPARLMEARRLYLLLPQELRELISLNKHVKKELQDAEHRRLARQSVR